MFSDALNTACMVHPTSALERCFIHIRALIAICIVGTHRQSTRRPPIGTPLVGIIGIEPSPEGAAYRMCIVISKLSPQ